MRILSFCSMVAALMAAFFSSPQILGGPPAPTGVNASDGLYADWIEVEWDDATGVEWEVWRATVNDVSKAVQLSDEWWNWVMDYNVSPGTLYYYWIRAFDYSGKSAFSAPDTGYAGEGADPGEGYTLEILSENGQIQRNPDRSKYPPGTQVTLTATPNSGYKFVGWYGDATGSQNPITLTLQANTCVEAMFELSAPPTGGSIRILIEPADVVQAGAQWRFAAQNSWRNSGDKVENLPFGNYTVVFKEISGWITPPSKAIQIASNLPNVTWTLTYEQQSGTGYKINIDAPNGAVGKSPDQTSYASGSQVQLTAQPNSGYRFDHWEGDVSGTANPVKVIMDRNKTIKAVFLPGTVTPVVKASHRASGYQSPGSVIITCAFEYPAERQLLSLRVAPQLPAAWSLTGASGDGTPEIQGHDIVFTGSLSSRPVKFQYTLGVPAGQTGSQSLSADAEYQLSGMINPETVAIDPDPLTVSSRSYHSADYREPYWTLDGTEVNRTLAYWRAGAYHVEPQGADQYAAGTGATNGAPHSADYRDPRWQIDGTEINRVLSYWRAGAYHANPAGADGYAPGSSSAGPQGKSMESLAAGPSISHSAPEEYAPGSTLTLSNSFIYNGQLLSLLWRPQLPAGWSLTSALGAGAPEAMAGEIVWVGSIPASRVDFVYTVQVPFNAQGAQQIAAQVEYQFSTDINPVQAMAQPNPLTLTTGEASGPLMAINLYAGITLTGTVGQKCQILATPNLAQTNTWSPMCEVILTNQTQIWVDPAPAREQQKMYKAVYLP